MGTVINVKGSYVDIHDNEHVHLCVDGAKVHIEERNEGGIENYFAEQKNAKPLLALLHELIDGRKGKEVALVVQCAQKALLLNGQPTYSLMVKEFGDIGTRSGYYRYLAYQFFDSEMEAVLKRFEHLK
jgi:hypothetical protein